MATLIQVQDDTWKRLNELKNKSESFDDVIKRKLNMEESKDGKDNKRPLEEVNSSKVSQS